MSLFIKQGLNYSVTSKDALDVHEILPGGNYIIKVNSQTEEMYLTKVADFSDPGRVYGSTMKTVDRILKTYVNRPNSTGVLLAGEKGSGKSLMAKEVSRLAMDLGIPTIIVSAPWCGEQFNDFLQNITQNCIVLFDELEKVYSKDKQAELLTLFDGVFPTKKLFMVTVNDHYSLSNYLMNRPGRIYYFLNFKGLGKEAIQEYIEANLLNKENADGVEIVASMFGEFNFDLLKAMVEEMNRYDETALEVLHYLNVRPSEEGNASYSVVLSIGGVVQNTDHYYPSIFTGSPFGRSGVGVRLSIYEEDEETGKLEDTDESELISMCITDLTDVDSEKNQITFVKGDKTVVLTRKVITDDALTGMYKLFSQKLTV